VPEIAISNNLKIIIIDDDSTIHQIWEKRFCEIEFLNSTLDIIHFSNPHDVKNWASHNNTENTLFLCDFEFIGHKTNGIDLIRNLNISSQSILVTSRYEEENVIRQCQNLSLNLIPKSMAEFVPLTSNPRLKEREKKTKLYDLVHLDDDELMRITWSFKAKSSGKKILSLASPIELDQHLSEIDLNTEFYIDSCLGDNYPKGQEVAKDLYSKGYKNLYLSTGYEKEDLPEFPWIKEVLGKEPPASLFSN
jgi:hypothetical protein